MIHSKINIHRPSRWFFLCGHSPALRVALKSADVVCDVHLFAISRKRIFKFQLQLLGYLVFL